MKKGYTYILECSDGSYYTGSTNDIEYRLAQHQNWEGANHTQKRLPVKLVYVETFLSIQEAFEREKQIQGWNRKKKEALAAADAVAREHGFSLLELTGKRAAGTSGPKSPAKYANPNDPSQTWSGRGRKPFWVVEWEGAGKSLEDCLI